MLFTLTATLAFAKSSDAIQWLTLDERVVVIVRVATNRVTTTSLPGPIAAIDAVGVNSEGRSSEQFQLAHKAATNLNNPPAFLPTAAFGVATTPTPDAAQPDSTPLFRP